MTEVTSALYFKSSNRRLLMKNKHHFSISTLTPLQNNENKKKYIYQDQNTYSIIAYNPKRCSTVQQYDESIGAPTANTFVVAMRSHK